MFISCFFQDKSLKPSEQINVKRKALGFSDELAFHKFAYGFYADRFPDDETKDLSQYGWFVGSLSEECLRNLLSDFLDSKEASQLHPATRMQLEHYLRVSETSKEEGYAIDLARSNNIGLLFLARTGMAVGTIFQGFSNLESEIEQKALQAIEKIKGLNPGETYFFSAGTMLHETKYSVKHIDEDLWEVTECDTNSKVLSVYQSSTKAIMDPEFWNKIYKKKFIPNYSLHNSKLFAAFEEADDKEIISASSITPQKKDTCHIKCHLGVLKSFVVRNSPLPINESIIEWRSFKLHFGNYILRQNKIKNQRLLSLAEKRQGKRKRAHEDASLFQECIESNRLEETLRAYETVFSYFGSSVHDFFPPNKRTFNLKDLLKLHQRCVTKLEQYPVTPEQWELFFERVENPWVSHALDSLKLRFNGPQFEWMDTLDKEFARLSTVRLLYDQMSEPIERKVNCLLAMHLGIYRDVTYIDISGAQERVPALHAHNLDTYLKRLEANPQLLTPIKLRKHFAVLLIQALQMGEAKRVEDILAQLPEKERDQFLADQGSKLHESLCLQLIPNSLTNYVQENSTTELSHKLIPVLGLKAIQTKDFQFIFDFQSHPALRKMPNGMYRLQDAVEKNPLSEEEIKKVSGKLAEASAELKSSSIYTGFICSLAYSLVKNRSFDLLEKLIQECKLPIPTYQHVQIENIPFLSVEDTEKWIELTLKYPEYPLSASLKYFLILPSYHHGLLEKMKPLEFTKNLILNSNAPSLKEFHFTWDPDNFEKGLALLQECTNIPYLSRMLFVDLLQLAYREQNLEMVKEICLIKKLDSLSTLVWYEVIDEKTLLFLSESTLRIGDTPSMLFCVSALLATKSFACYELANTIIEKLQTQDKKVLGNIEIEDSNRTTVDQARVRYQKKYPKTLLSRILTQKALNTYFTRMHMSNSNYPAWRQEFIENWLSSLQTDNAKELYRMNIAPIFECNEQTLPKIIDIWEHLPPSKVLRDAFALLFLKNGFREHAYWVYPDHEGLETLLL